MVHYRTKRSGWSTPLLALLLLASPVAAGANPVHDDLTHGYGEAALALLEKQPSLARSLDDMRCTPLHLAAQYGQVEVVRWLLAHNVQVNAQAYNGFTPLHLAKSAAVARLLLESGADPTIRDSRGKTALQVAAQEHHTEVADAIVAAGYPLDLASALLLGKRDIAKTIIHEQPDAVKNASIGSDLWGDTSPLGIAAGQGDTEMVQLLLKAGAPVNEGPFMSNAGGRATPLYNAVWAGHVETVSLLCEAGADCNVIGGWLLAYAEKQADKSIAYQIIADILVAHGAGPVAGLTGLGSRLW